MYYKEVIFESDDKRQVICERNKYNIVKNVSWKDVKMKIYLDANNDQTRNAIGRGVSGGDSSGESLPGTIMGAYNEICGKTSPWRVIHLYYSFKDNAICFLRHKDRMDVLLVQAIGKMSYKFDNGRVCTLNPGDSLYIPLGIYHEPITSKPRVTLSCSRTPYDEMPPDADAPHPNNVYHPP